MYCGRYRRDHGLRICGRGSRAGGNIRSVRAFLIGPDGVKHRMQGIHGNYHDDKEGEDDTHTKQSQH